MPTCFYPTAEWLAETFKRYGSVFEDKLKTLSGHFAYHILADQAFGIEKDLYICMVLDAGKLTRLEYFSGKDAKKDADFIMEAVPTVWKKIFTKLDTFISAFMGGRIKLEKGDTLGALAFGAHGNTLVDAFTQVNLKFPDDLSPDELAIFKSSFEDYRIKSGV